ncbi:hypothetical protein [Streptomyces sp. ID05-18]|uniref:hypothetical protein n=1 Tax=Streptomyces sp. ID05-18 TaxID=3028662 RepID=UPI0029A60D4B|nr:hypothetical protein [Streptomyces sp. ID05-18]MDX3489097.1 hypothetical protein [Streptomyces sp. ID05-18]
MTGTMGRGRRCTIDFTESCNCFTESCNCTFLLPSVTSGTGAYTASTTASCGLTLDGPYSYTETYTWNTGQSSTVTYTTGETVRAANGTTTVTSIGTVTVGLGAGCVVRGGGKAGLEDASVRMREQAHAGFLPGVTKSSW